MGVSRICSRYKSDLSSTSSTTSSTTQAPTHPPSTLAPIQSHSNTSDAPPPMKNAPPTDFEVSTTVYYLIITATVMVALLLCGGKLFNHASCFLLPFLRVSWFSNAPGRQETNKSIFMFQHD